MSAHFPSGASGDELLSLARDALAEAGEGDAEVYLTHVHRGMARFAISEVGQHVAIDEPEAQVRVARGARVGEASTSELTREGVVAAIRAAAELAELVPPRETWPGFAGADARGDARDDAFVRWSDETASAGPEVRIDALAPILETIRDAGLVAAGALQTLVTSAAIATTRGLARTHRATLASARVWALETAGAGGAAGFDTAIARTLGGLDGRALATRAVRDALDAKRARRAIPAGTYDVVLEPEAVGRLLEWLGLIALPATEVESGASLMAGRLGERVTGEHVTLIEDPRGDEGCRDTLTVPPFDREGSPRRRVVCIERGVARAVLHDRTTAARAGIASTGSAGAGWFSPGVTPGASAMVLAGGEAESVDALLAQMGRGLHVRRLHYVNGFLEPRRAVMTGLTRDGTFLVEDGKRVASVGNLRFTDSIAEAFARIEGLTRAVAAVGAHYADECAIRAPAVLIRGLVFTSGTPPERDALPVQLSRCRLSVVKACPFCAEQIQDNALKCRFCNSMLNAAPGAGPGGAAAIAPAMAGAPPVAPLPYAAPGGAHPGGSGGGGKLLFDGHPSWKSFFWPYAGATSMTFVGIVLAGYLGIAYRENYPQLAFIGAAIFVFGVIWFLVEHFKRRGMHVRITTETIDVETGILGKRIDSIQLWRVRDVDFQQSLMERILGVATIQVISHDATTPNLMVRGVPGGRQLFQELRDQIALTRQGRNVVGMVD